MTPREGHFLLYSSSKLSISASRRRLGAHAVMDAPVNTRGQVYEAGHGGWEEQIRIRLPLPLTKDRLIPVVFLDLFHTLLNISHFSSFLSSTFCSSPAYACFLSPLPLIAFHQPFPATFECFREPPVPFLPLHTTYFHPTLFHFPHRPLYIFHPDSSFFPLQLFTLYLSLNLPSFH